MADDDFERLPRKLQLKIDAAFDASLSSHSGRPPPKKRRKLGPSPIVAESAGGFIIDEALGGFVPPSEGEEENHFPLEDDVIPFFLVPTALQKLDLPPDDEEVLQVFRNAAGGWSSATTAGYAHDTQNTGADGAVSRSDFRAVCAVVISSRGNDAEAEDPSDGVALKDEQATDSASGETFQEDIIDEDAEEDVYTEEGTEHSPSSFSDPENDTDSDEFIMGAAEARSKSRSKSNYKQTRSEPPGAPTPRQRRTALETYALFFPSSSYLSDEDLAKVRVMYKDIVRVADFLKEKIRADEITEMLSLFSTSADLSMSFEDFTRMMIMAKLA